MQTVHKTPAFALTADVADITGELLVIPIFENDDCRDIPATARGRRAGGAHDAGRSRPDRGSRSGLCPPYPL